jgi:tetratricopeptide (TPR) repeat protein
LHFHLYKEAFAKVSTADFYNPLRQLKKRTIIMKKKVIVLAMIVLTVTVFCNPLSAGAFKAKDGDLKVINQYLALMGNYLNIADKWVSMVKDDDTAVYLAVESLVEIYKEQGDKRKAIPKLRSLLNKYKSRKTVCRAILFKIKDIYKDNKEYDKALKVINEIIDLD